MKEYKVIDTITEETIVKFIDRMLELDLQINQKIELDDEVFQKIAELISSVEIPDFIGDYDKIYEEQYNYSKQELERVLRDNNIDVDNIIITNENNINENKFYTSIEEFRKRKV